VGKLKCDMTPEEIERNRARGRAYNAANKEMCNAKCRAYHEAHKEEQNVKARAYYEAHREELKAKVSIYRKKNQVKIKAVKKKYGQSVKGKRVRKSAALRNSYGISIEDFERMYAEQAGLCAICGKEIIGKNCYVDHNHETGKIRCLLCSNCNTGLGFFKDSGKLLLLAAKYVIDNE
jgi:hypothetical protein